MKLIGVGGEETLVRTGFVLGTSNHAEFCKGLVQYVAKSDDGTTVSGSVDCEIRFSDWKYVEPVDVLDDD